MSGPGRTTLSKHCRNIACGMFGAPRMGMVQTIVTFDAQRKRHLSHNDVAVRRRPTFAAPVAPENASS